MIVMIFATAAMRSPCSLGTSRIQHDDVVMDGIVLTRESSVDRELEQFLLDLLRNLSGGCFCRLLAAFPLAVVLIIGHLWHRPPRLAGSRRSYEGAVSRASGR